MQSVKALRHCCGGASYIWFFFLVQESFILEFSGLESAGQARLLAADKCMAHYKTRIYLLLHKSIVQTKG